MDDQTPEGDVAVVEADEQRKDFSKDDRDKLAKSGAALPDGSFPIVTEQDLKNAISAFGRAKDPAAAKAHIIKRAKSLGLASLIPDDWQKNEADTALEHRKAIAEQLSHRRMSERRASTGPIEVRQADDGKLHVGGYASVFDAPYDMGMYSETVQRGAFTKTLNEGAQVHLLLNHSGLPLASTLNQTLSLKEDGIGLRYDATLDPDDPDSVAAVRKIRSGLMQQSSFAFQPVRQAWSDDYTQRALTEVSIDRGDVSIVNFGASPATTTDTRGALENFERRAVGFALELVEGEERAGAKFSAGNLATLKSVLSLVARADTAVDQAQIDLSDLIGVKNPDIAQDAKLEQKADDAEGETRDGADEVYVTEPIQIRAGARVIAEQVVHFAASRQAEAEAEERAAPVPEPLVLPDHTQAARAMLARARRSDV